MSFSWSSIARTAPALAMAWVISRFLHAGGSQWAGDAPAGHPGQARRRRTGLRAHAQARSCASTWVRDRVCRSGRPGVRHEYRHGRDRRIPRVTGRAGTAADGCGQARWLHRRVGTRTVTRSRSLCQSPGTARRRPTALHHAGGADFRRLTRRHGHVIPELLRVRQACAAGQLIPDTEKLAVHKNPEDRLDRWPAAIFRRTPHK